MSYHTLQISAPLETTYSTYADDSSALPEQLTEALEYVSNRLVRKQLHLSFIVVRKPVEQSQAPSPTSSSPVDIFGDNEASYPRTYPRPESVSSRSSHSSKSSRSSKSSSSSKAESRTRWPGLPTSPKMFKESGSRPSISSPPTSTSTSSSASSRPSTRPASTPWSPRSTTANPFGISLIHACTLTPRAERTLRDTLARAEKKFAIGTGYLSAKPLANAISCPKTNELIRRSLRQNAVVFSGEGLTLLELDRVYGFKCALRAYAVGWDEEWLERAVESLRSLVQVSRHSRVSQRELRKAYPGIGVDEEALEDVDDGYRAVVGWGAVEFQGMTSQSQGRAQAQARRVEKVVMPRIDTSERWQEVEVGESAQGVDEDVTPVFRYARVVGDGWEREDGGFKGYGY